MNAQVEEVDLVADVKAVGQVEEVSNDVDVTWSPEEASEAEAMGWIPPERSKKLPEGKTYVGPVEYMERNPLYKQMKALQTNFTELNDHYKKVSEMEHKKAEQEFEKRISDLKAEKVKALDEADHSRVVDIDEEIRTTEKPVEEKRVDQAFNQWVDENKWYSDDAFLQIEADELGGRLISQDLVGIPLFEKVKSHLMEKYPNKFSNPARNKASVVEGGSQRPSKSRGVSESDLTADERTVYLNFKNSGAFPSKEDCQAYFEQVIAIRD